MSKIINAMANENYTVTIDFEQGNRIIYNMQKQVKTLPFIRLNDIECFKSIKFDDKSIYWDESDNKSIIQQRLSLDNILFSLRD